MTYMLSEEEFRALKSSSEEQEKARKVEVETEVKVKIILLYKNVEAAVKKYSNVSEALRNPAFRDFLADLNKACSIAKE